MSSVWSQLIASLYLSADAEAAADVGFVCADSGEEARRLLHAHKFLLALRSPVLRTMFAFDEKCGDNDDGAGLGRANEKGGVGESNGGGRAIKVGRAASRQSAARYSFMYSKSVRFTLAAQVIRVEDIRTGTMRRFLKYIYTEELELGDDGTLELLYVGG